MKFTVDSIARLQLPPGKTEHVEYNADIPGHGIRLRRRKKGAAKYWFIDYAIGEAIASDNPEKRARKKRRRFTYGTYPAMKVPAACEKAEKFHAEIVLGNDPQAVKEENRVRAGETYEACVRLYLAWRRNDPKKKLRPSTLGEIERHLTRNLKELNPLRIDKVDRRALAVELARFASEGGPVQANRTGASAHKFFKWCVGEGFIEVNPATDINKNPEAARDRVLTVAELAAIWRVLPDGDYGDIVKLLTLTGQREREIGDLHWSEIDIENATVTLPPARTKNRREHTFPLSGPALAILKARHEARGPERGLVFGRGKGDRGFSGWSKSKERLDAALPLPAWVVHDLRRSFSTGLGNLGTPPHICEMLLNHQSGTKAGVSGRYNLSNYEREGRQAVALWADTITAVVEGHASNVTTLKRAG